MVVVHPPLVAYLSQERADQLADAGLFADDPSGMAIAWPRLGGMWATTVERARLLPEKQLDERVDGEWSFVETLRHLIFLTDAWVGDVIEEEPVARVTARATGLPSSDRLRVMHSGAVAAGQGVTA